MQRPTPVIFAKNKSKSKNQRRNRRRKRQNKQQQQQQHHHHGREIFAASSSIPPQAGAPSAGSRLWMQTYENIVRWQAEHQASYWKNLAQKLKSENDELRDKLKTCEQKGDEGPESSSSEDVAEEEFTVDEEYLDFMEVTRKHQESMRLLRAEEEGGGQPKASNK